MRKSALVALGVAAGVVSAITGYACADGGYSPSWELAKDSYDPGGSSAMLTPGNDTRVNLLLLLADRRGTTVRDLAAKQEGPPLVLFPWRIMSAAALPVAGEDSGGWTEPSRCQTNASGAADFIAALRANRRIPADEKIRLEAARTRFVANCGGGNPPPEPGGATSPAGRAFATYLTAAADFYAGRFEQARTGFAALAGAPDPWLRESGLYMVARTELNRAQISSFDEYGSLAEPEKRDTAAIAAAGTALMAYLQAYPSGRYASSARGLNRRVAWLLGHDDALASAFDRQLGQAGAFDGAATDIDLIDEIDLKLLSGKGPESRDPVLLAVIDLQRMRCEDDYQTPAEDCEPQITRAELERQAPVFARHRALFDYLRAAEAYFVRKQPREVLALIPDAARQARFTYLEFSRQMLRGLALQASGDSNARNFWLSLFPGSVQPYQREALELALAEHEERSGGLARIFAPGSQIRHPIIRQLLLERVAGPDLLRQQARDQASPRQERDVALYMLLARELRYGRYRDFLGDIRMLPPDASGDSHWWSATHYDSRFNPTLQPPPLGLLGPKAAGSDAGCPALTATVGQLAAAPAAIRPRLCLAEYFRSNGFDWFDEDEPWSTGLASSKTQFPGKPYHRLELYKAVIADPRATADDRALALNRAVRCYAPGGNNSCGGTDVPLAQRRAWYNRLKRDFPQSRWAQSLKHYW
jgi:hypothetical protein